MSEEETNEAEEESSPSEEGGDEGGSSGGLDIKKIILFAVVPLLLLGGAGAYFMGLFGGAEEPVKEGEHQEEKKEEAEKADEGKGGVFLEIPTMIVNLNNAGGPPRYLRLTVQLELKKEEDLAAVNAVMPRVIDQFQTYLRELRVRDLRGSAGIYRLQVELLWRVNQAAAPTEIKDILFQEILIQ